MSGDGWDSGDLFTGLLLGWLFSQNSGPRPSGHSHGDRWHEHVCPPGYHVHDGHPDGPIRIVPPTPEQVAAEEERRTRKRMVWAVLLAVLGLVTLRAPWFGLPCLGLGLLLGFSGWSSRVEDRGHELHEADSDEMSATHASATPVFDPEASPGPPSQLPASTSVKRQEPGVEQGSARFIESTRWNLRLEIVGKPYVVRHSADRLSVLLRLRNHGRTVQSVRLTASLLASGQIVGVADNWAEDFPHGATRAVELTTFSPPAEFNDLEFQVDDAIL